MTNTKKFPIMYTDDITDKITKYLGAVVRVCRMITNLQRATEHSVPKSSLFAGSKNWRKERGRNMYTFMGQRLGGLVWMANTRQSTFGIRSQYIQYFWNFRTSRSKWICFEILNPIHTWLNIKRKKKRKDIKFYFSVLSKSFVKT